MRVLIVGCGYVGVATGAELVRQGHEVWGLRRSTRAKADLEAVGIVPILADITVPESLPQPTPRYDWVIHCVSASGGSDEDYRRVYVEGTQHLLKWLSTAPPDQLIYTGSTSVYGQTDGSVVDEASPTEPQTPTGRLLLETERLVLDWAKGAKQAAVILRLGAIYGLGRAHWLEQFQAGKARLDAEGMRIVNMIHRDDVAGAVIASLARARSGKLYNAVDDEPVSQLGLFQWLSRRLNRALPPPGPRQIFAGKRGATSKRVSNRALKEELGYRFKFPSFRDGFEQILRHKF